MDKLDLTVETQDIDKLLQQIHDSSSIYASFSFKLEDIKSKIMNKSITIKVLESNIAQVLRADNNKISETRIDKMLWENEEYICAQKELNQLKTQEGKVKAIVKGLEMRHLLLIQTIQLLRGELRKII